MNIRVSYRKKNRIQDGSVNAASFIVKQQIRSYFSHLLHRFSTAIRDIFLLRTVFVIRPARVSLLTVFGRNRILHMIFYDKDKPCMTTFHHTRFIYSKRRNRKDKGIIG